MRRLSELTIALAFVLAAATDALSATNLVVRKQTTLRGDFVLIGNTLGHDAAANVPPPIVGNVGAAGLNTTENAPDVYWRSNSPFNGAAEANTSIASTQARSQAVLTLPAGGTVKYARLYWAAIGTTPTADTQVTLSRIGAGGFSTSVTADASGTTPAPMGGTAYQSTADITSLVQSAGAGAFQLADVDIAPFLDQNNAGLFAAWSMVVVYALPSAPPREITIHDGIGFVIQGSPAQASISRIQPLPPSGVSARLGIVVYEGDANATGDSLLFNGNLISDANNVPGNFFNGTRTFLGNPSSTAGDLPQLGGQQASMCGIDIDVVDVTAFAPPVGTTTVTMQSAINGDQYHAGYVVLSVSVPLACVGDVTDDGVINTADLTALLGNFGQSVPPFTGGDFNGDGVVNTADLTTLLGLFGTNCP